MTAGSSKARKRKGRDLQNLVRELLVKELEIPEADVLSTPMGLAGCDILLSKGARERFPFGVECKSQEALSIWAALEQCEENARKEALIPALVFKRARTSPWVAIPISEFIMMARLRMEDYGYRKMVKLRDSGFGERNG
jgi:hypothetical protein